MSKDGKSLIPPTSYRIPPALKAALAKRAAANRRSASQELIVALEKYLAEPQEPLAQKSSKPLK